MAYFQSGLTTAWHHKKTKSSLALSGYVRYFYLSVTAQRHPPSVTHRLPIKWFTCLVTGSEWQTTWGTVSWIAGSWPVLQARRLLFFFSFSSPSNAAALIARGWHVSRTGSTFFFCCFICIERQRETFRVSLCTQVVRFPPRPSVFHLFFAFCLLCQSHCAVII